jgi:CRISPR-associated protein Cmr3
MPNWVVVGVRILIKPNDVLLFRESKNFNAEEAHLARSQLPLPQTIAGAIRSKILVSNEFSGEALKLAGLKKRDDGRYESADPEFEIIGQFFYKRESGVIKEYFRAPMDIVKSKGVDGCFYAKPINILGSYIFGGKDIHFKSISGYIEGNNLIKYLKGELSERELDRAIVEENELFKRESRVGIKLDNSKTTEEGYFYKIEFLRFAMDAGISVCLGKNANEVKKCLGNDGSKFLKLGGENRFATFEFDDSNSLENYRDSWKDIRKKINVSGKFKLYIATPILNCIRCGEDKKGLYSWDIRKAEITLNDDGHSGKRLDEIIEIKNVYPLIGKPITMSGWDYALNSPKGNRHAIPSGSVYFVEFNGEFKLDEPYLKLGELTKLGYGLCFVGVW